MNSVLRIGLAASLLSGVSLFGSVVDVTVNNTASIYTAGQPGASALEVLGVNVTAGNSFTFAVTGTVSGAGCTSNTPDGCSNFLSNSPGTGVARYSGPAQALVGIFLGAATPGGPDPLTYFAATWDATFNPGLLQPFFIGDGWTGTGSGTRQTFVAPAGATRLFLGISDNPGYFHDNGGSFSVTVGDGIVEQAILVAAPEPSTYFLVGMALVGMAVRRNKKK